MNDLLICVDFGGTKTRSALFDLGKQTPQKKFVLPTPRHESGKNVLENIGRVIREVWPSSGDVKALIIGAPGPLDVDKGIIIDAPLFQDLHNIPVASYFEQEFGIRTFLQNDANLAALGEYAYGAGIGSSVMIYITISTGVGGGIVIDDHLLTGSKGFGGEIGHICIYPDGFLCGCGHRGCLEAHASGSAIEAEAYRAIHQGLATSLLNIFKDKAIIQVEDIVIAALNGDFLSKEILNRAARSIGIGLASLVNIFNPDCIVIGGGVSNAGSIILDVIKNEVSIRAMYPMCEQAKVVSWRLGDDAGLYGAFYYGKKKIDSVITESNI